MAHYVIETSHNEGECLQVLYIISAYVSLSIRLANLDGMLLMINTWFGCMVGIHTGWLNIEADSEGEAGRVLPLSLREQARVVEVQKFTLQQIKSLHG